MEQFLARAGQPHYVPLTTGVAAPTRSEIIDAGFLSNHGKIILLDVLAAEQRLLESSPPDSAARSRWSYPAGTLSFNRKGVMFITEGKRIGRVEQVLGGKLFSVFSQTGSMFAEHIGGNIVGEGLISLISGLHDTKEFLERGSFIERGLAHHESVFVPLNRIVCMSLSFEPNNRYGLLQLNVTTADETETLTSYSVLWREEDDDRSFQDYVSFCYFLRLNYEQWFLQSLLFRRFAGPALAVPGHEQWLLNVISFDAAFYDRAQRALAGTGTMSADDVLQEALYHSRRVLPFVQAFTKAPALSRYALRDGRFDGWRPLCLSCFTRAERAAPEACASCGKAI